MNKYREKLECMVESALAELYENDKYLITHAPIDLSHGRDGHVSERGIVARFAIYLQGLLCKDGDLKDFISDVEYNRNLDRPKYLPKTAWEDNGAYPDLIVHKRGRNDGNLLIIEFKTHWNKASGKVESDIEKLQAFLKDPYSYENALFVMLNCDAPKTWWIDGDIDGKEIARNV